MNSQGVKGFWKNVLYVFSLYNMSFILCCECMFFFSIFKCNYLKTHVILLQIMNTKHWFYKTWWLKKYIFLFISFLHILISSLALQVFLSSILSVLETVVLYKLTRCCRALHPHDTSDQLRRCGPQLVLYRPSRFRVLKGSGMFPLL